MTLNPANLLYRKQAQKLARKKSMPGNTPRALRIRIKSIKATIAREVEARRLKSLKNEDPTIKQLYFEAREREHLGKPIFLDFNTYSHKIFRTISTNKSQYSWVFAVKPTGGFLLEREDMLLRLQRMVDKQADAKGKIAKINKILRDLKQANIRLSKVTSSVYHLTSGRDFWERERSSEQFRHNTIDFTQRLETRMSQATALLNSIKKPLALKEAEKARLERDRIRALKRDERIAKRNRQILSSQN